MHFDLLQSISQNGIPGKPNDDHFGATRTRAWVIDGGTDLGDPGLLGAQGGAAWLSATASHGFALSNVCGIEPACTDMFTHVAARFSQDKTRPVQAAWELPKAAFAAVELSNSQLQVGWAADCSVLHMTSAGPVWRTSAPDSSKEAADALALGTGIGSLSVRSSDVLADRRAQREKADHSAISPDPVASANATRFATCPAEAGDEVLVMSDGFSALVSDYARYDAAQLWDAIKTRGLADLLQELRTIETDDAACLRYPRFKVSDDATAMWLRVTAV